MAPTDWELAFSETRLRFYHTECLRAATFPFSVKNKIMDISSSSFFKADNNGLWQFYISILKEEISRICLKLIGKRMSLPPLLWDSLWCLEVQVWKTPLLRARHAVGGLWAGMCRVRVLVLKAQPDSVESVGNVMSKVSWAFVWSDGQCPCGWGPVYKSLSFCCWTERRVPPFIWWPLISYQLREADVTYAVSKRMEAQNAIQGHFPRRTSALSRRWTDFKDVCICGSKRLVWKRLSPPTKL